MKTDTFMEAGHQVGHPAMTIQLSDVLSCGACITAFSPYSQCRHERARRPVFAEIERLSRQALMNEDLHHGRY